MALVGLMGSGKSTVGRAVADRLGRPFVDLDRQIEDGAGRTIAELFAGEEGERGFRAREREALAAVLRSPHPAVVATGGGVVLDAGNRAALADRAVVVWLRVTAAEAARRVGDDPARPLLAGGGPDALARLAAERAPLYDAVAGVVVDVDDRDVGEVVDAVMRALRTGSGAAGGVGTVGP